VSRLVNMQHEARLEMMRAVQSVYADVIRQALDDVRCAMPITPEEVMQAWRWWVVRRNHYRHAVFCLAGLAGMEQQARRKALELIVQHYEQAMRMARKAHRSVRRRVLHRLEWCRMLAERQLEAMDECEK